MHLDVIQSNQPKCWLLENSDVGVPEFLRFKFCSIEDQVSVAITCHKALEIFKNIAKSGFSSFLTSSLETANPKNYSEKTYINQMIKTHLFIEKLGFPRALLQFNKLEKLIIHAFNCDEAQVSSQFEKMLYKVKKLPSLKKLDFGWYRYYFKPALQLIEKTPNLTDLRINIYLVNFEIFECLKNKSSLTNLTLSGMQEDETLRGGFRFLKSLKFDGFSASPNWVVNFSKEIKLEVLDIRTCTLHPVAFQSLLSSNLKELSLYDLRPFNETYSKAIIDTAPNLESCIIETNGDGYNYYNNNEDGYEKDFLISNSFLEPFFNALNLKILSVSAEHFAPNLSINLVNELALKFKNMKIQHGLSLFECYLRLKERSMLTFDDKFKSFCQGEISVITLNDEEDEVEDELEDEEEMKS